MELRDLGPDGQQALEQTLGYLNFSSGAPDNQFLLNLNQLFAQVEDQLLSDSGTSQRCPKQNRFRLGGSLAPFGVKNWSN